MEISVALVILGSYSLPLCAFGFIVWKIAHKS